MSEPVPCAKSIDSDDSGHKVIKLFSCSAQLSMKFSLLINMKMPMEFSLLINMKMPMEFSLLINMKMPVKFSLLINMKMPTVVGIFIYISRESLMLSYV